MDYIRRSSLAGVTGKQDTSEKRNSRVLSMAPKNKLEIVIESPPCIFQLNPSRSTGCFLAGKLRVHVLESSIHLASLKMRLLFTTSTKKPVQKDCPECISQNTEVNHWEFLTAPKILDKKVHDFPFSHLLPGNLPTTTYGRIAKLEYFLFAEGTTSTGEKLTLRVSLPVLRALKPGNDKTILRTFSPTKMTVNIIVNPIIHSTGDFDVKLVISGISNLTKDGSTSRWCLCKVDWRIHEEEKIVSPACNVHAHKIGGTDKAVLYEESHTVGQKGLSRGWKTDWSEGKIEMQFTARPSSSSAPICDVESPSGMTVLHHLTIELIVAEQRLSPGRTKATCTGAANVLRIQIPLHVTERASAGMIWDEDELPLYEDVPARPPLYDTQGDILDYTGPPLDEPPPIEFGANVGENLPQYGEAESSRVAAARKITADD